jgi:hypothetical protein
MLYGYARVSTIDQDLSIKESALLGASGCSPRQALSPCPICNTPADSSRRPFFRPRNA